MTKPLLLVFMALASTAAFSMQMPPTLEEKLAAAQAHADLLGERLDTIPLRLVDDMRDLEPLQNYFQHYLRSLYEIAKIEPKQIDFKGISYGQALHQGRREYMQDAALIHNSEAVKIFAVFDGHGKFGAEVAGFAKEHLLTSCLNNNQLDIKKFISYTRDIDQRLADEHEDWSYYGGSTMCACAIVEENFNDDNLYLVNLGDSAAIIYRKDKTVAKTLDHSPRKNESELNRINDLGAYLYKNDYINRLIKVSRSIGDGRKALRSKLPGKLNQKIISSNSDNYLYKIDKDVDFIVIATDGLWDYLDPNIVISSVVEIRKEMCDCLGQDHVTNNMARLIAERIAFEALYSSPYKPDRSTDNIAIQIIFFNKPTLEKLNEAS